MRNRQNTYRNTSSRDQCGARRNRRTARRGATLIDVAIGSMLLTVLLIPAVHAIGKSQSANRRLVNREIMLYEAEQIIETVKVQLANTTSFDAVMAAPVDVRRNIAISDGPDLIGRLRAGPDTSMPTARLVSIVADVWYDANSNGLFDRSEQGESLQTQWAAP